MTDAAENENFPTELQQTLRGIAPTPITAEDCSRVFDAVSPDADSKAVRRLYRFVTIAKTVAELAWPDDESVGYLDQRVGYYPHGKPPSKGAVLHYV